MFRPNDSRQGSRSYDPRDRSEWGYDGERFHPESSYRSSWAGFGFSDNFIDVPDRPERQQFFGRGPKGYKRSDERILDEVCERLARYKGLDLSDLEVRVDQAEVTLSGSVTDRHQKRIAEDIAQSVLGVEDVHNRLRVGGPSSQHVAYDDL